MTERYSTQFPGGRTLGKTGQGKWEASRNKYQLLADSRQENEVTASNSSRPYYISNVLFKLHEDIQEIRLFIHIMAR